MFKLLSSYKNEIFLLPFKNKFYLNKFLINQTFSTLNSFDTNDLSIKQTKQHLSLEEANDLKVDILADKLDELATSYSNSNLNDNDKSFKLNELIVCKIFNRKFERYSSRLIKLKKNAIFKTRMIEIFHEHIIDKSFYCLNSTKMTRNSNLKSKNNLNVSFKLISSRVDFKRPNLYEYIQLKQQQAVSSHFSVITLVPLLLEIGKDSRVLECGTGSGSMTLFLSQSLGNNGVLHTFDIDQNKALHAKQYFWDWKNSFDLTANENEKWPANVKFGAIDFCNDDRLRQNFPNFYDAVYLDMSETEKGVEKAYDMLKIDGCLVMNCLHITQILKCLNVIEKKGLGLEKELVIEPGHRYWELRKIKEQDLDWVCRIEDRFVEKFKRGGLFFNYWQGYLVKFRKIK